MSDAVLSDETAKIVRNKIASVWEIVNEPNSIHNPEGSESPLPREPYDSFSIPLTESYSLMIEYKLKKTNAGELLIDGRATVSGRFDQDDLKDTNYLSEVNSESEALSEELAEIMSEPNFPVQKSHVRFLSDSFGEVSSFMWTFQEPLTEFDIDGVLYEIQYEVEYTEWIYSKTRFNSVEEIPINTDLPVSVNTVSTYRDTVSAELDKLTELD